MPRGNLPEHIQNSEASITVFRRLQWASVAAGALHLVHCHGIIHCDVKPVMRLRQDTPSKYSQVCMQLTVDY